MPLTDVTVRSAKPTDKPQKLFDGGGLFLLVNPNGAKYWRWKYRFQGKEKLLAAGVYPDVSLRQARAKRDEWRSLLASGVDPGETRRAQRTAADERSANSFEVVAREWLAKRDWVHKYRIKVEAWFDNDVFPWIGSRPVDELGAPDFLSMLRRVEKRGALESAHRIQQNCGQVMRYAIATGRASRNPVAEFKGALTPAPERHHAAITDVKGIGGLLRAIDDYKGSHVTRCALQPASLVFVRPGEAAARRMVGDRSRRCRMDHPRGEDEDGRGPHRAALRAGYRGAARAAARDRTRPLRVSRRALDSSADER